MKKFSISDPYQLLFPLALIHGLWGVGLWIGHSLKWFAYPAINHSYHMVLGFLLTFAAGFLLTAIPRFTGSQRCSRFELGLAVLFSGLLLFFPHPIWGLAQLILLSIFMVNRFLTKNFSPPIHFIFLPLGLALGIISTALLTLIQQQIITSAYTNAAKILLFQGMMLAFLLGVGAKLIPAILGFADPIPHRIAKVNTLQKAQRLLDYNQWLAIFLLITFTSSLLLEIFYIQPQPGRLLRASIASFMACYYWKLYLKPRAQSKLAFWLWISAWSLVLGLWAYGLFPQFGIHGAHLIFIGGLSLSTLIIASRVVLAHGGYPVSFETSSKAFSLVSGFALLATATRFSAIYINHYFQHLAYAALMLTIAFLIWIGFFIKKIFVR